MSALLTLCARTVATQIGGLKAARGEKTRQNIAASPSREASKVLGMSGPERLANSLNRWARDGLDTVGGADGDALNHLILEYFDSEVTTEQCKSHNNNSE